MSLCVFGSAKGAPGVTTTVLSLAAVWPPPRAVLVVELDPDGGDAAAWLGLCSDPGLMTCAAEGRRTVDASMLMRHSQPLPDRAGAGLLAGPAAAEEARAAVRALCTAGLADALDRLPEHGVDVDVLADCGRLAPGSVALPLATAAHRTVLIARPVLGQVTHLRSRVAALSERCAVSLVLIGDRPIHPSQVSAAAGAPILGVLAHDARAAAAAARPPGLSPRTRSALWRSAADIAAALAGGQPVRTRKADRP